MPYRLDLADPVQIEGESLPQYWTKKVADYFVKHDSAVIVNLASEEYSTLLESRKLNDKKTVIKIEFRTVNNGKLINGATHSKMARGQFLRKRLLMALMILNCFIINSTVRLLFYHDVPVYNHRWRTNIWNQLRKKH